ncbi:MAG: SMP-30/gluconolactonase/LRE family protein [Longimicrobiales bacterium]
MSKRTGRGYAFRRVCAIVLALGSGACGSDADDASWRLVMTVPGFDAPESVIHDPEQDVYFVSNIAGDAAERDNNGFISRVSPDGTIDSLGFVRGGRHGVDLHAPKGMAIVGNTLWVADLDGVKAFSRWSGEAAGGFDLSATGAEFLNDLALTPDGALYASDTRLERLFRISPGREVSTVGDSETLSSPNGLLWDEESEGLLIASFEDSTIAVWDPTSGEPPSVLATGVGGLDGLARLGDRLFVSSLSDNAVFMVSGDRLLPAFQTPGPADIAADQSRDRLLVPLLRNDQIQFWQRGG